MYLLGCTNRPKSPNFQTLEFSSLGDPRTTMNHHHVWWFQMFLFILRYIEHIADFINLGNSQRHPKAAWYPPVNIAGDSRSQWRFSWENHLWLGDFSLPKWPEGKPNITIYDNLIGGLEHEWSMTFHILGISSSQLTNSIIFQRGRSTTNQ